MSALLSISRARSLQYLFRHPERSLGYTLIAIVKADSPYKTLADLKGKRVAHTSPSSNSGNLAPRVFFPENGLVPDTDYKPVFSGGHDKSVLGVARGDYDMAAVASDVYDRIVARSDVKGNRTTDHLARVRSSRPRHSQLRTTSNRNCPKRSELAMLDFKFPESFKKE